LKKTNVSEHRHGALEWRTGALEWWGKAEGYTKIRTTAKILEALS